MPENELRKRIEVKCPHCNKDVNLTRDNKGRWIASLSGVTLGGIIGGFIGAGIGIATGGWGMAGTIPVGVGLGSLLGGSGYVIGDKFLDKFKCPSCKGEIRIN